MTAFKRTKLKNARVAWAKLIDHWPVAVWLGAIAVVVFLWSGTTEFSGIMGVVETDEEAVAPLQTARLISVDVRVGDQVAAGQVLAKLDTSLLEAELTLSEAELMENQSTVANYQENIFTLIRQFKTAWHSASLDLQREKQSMSEDDARLAELRKILTEREKMATSGLISRTEVDVLRPEIAALDRKMKEYPGLIKILETQAQEAKRGLADMTEWLHMASDPGTVGASNTLRSADEIAGIHRAVYDATRMMIDMQRQSYTLRATAAGVVAEVFATPGQVVDSGTPIVRLVSTQSDTVVGFLPEDFLDEIAEGEETFIYRVHKRNERHRAEVVSIAPDVMALPGRISPIAGVTVRGRRIILRVTDQSNLIPGETVRIVKKTFWDAFFGVGKKKAS